MAPAKPYVHPDVARVRALFEPTVGAAGYGDRPLLEQLTLQAERLAAAAAAGDPGAEVLAKNRDPGADPATAGGARRLVALDHGFEGWAAVEAAGAAPPDPRFEAAVDAVVEGRLGELGALLDETPELARARSSMGHGATLLHYLAANGTEIRRQVVSAHAPAAARLLREAGADPDARAGAHGGSVTPLELAASSAHPAAAGIARELADALSPGVEPEAFREAMGRWAAGVAVVAVRDGGRVYATTVTAFAPLSLRPPLVGTSLGGGAQALPFLRTGAAFAVSVLAEDGGRTASVFADAYPVGPSPFPPDGPPLLEDALAGLSCTVTDRVRTGDHTLVVGRVDAVAPGPPWDPDARPLVHWLRAYRRLEGG